MRRAGYVMLISSALHFVGVALGGFASATFFLLGPAVLYIVLYAGLARGMIWVAWIAFICMLGGTAGALAAIYDPWPIPNWVFASIAATDLFAAVLLFGALWRGRSNAHA